MGQFLSQWTVSTVILVIACTGLWASLASANSVAPAINNEATYVGEIGSDPSSMVPFDMSMKLVSLDSQRRQYLRETTTTVDGQSQTSNDWIDQGELFSTSSFPQILTTCRLMGGSPTRVTIPAGTFDSCQVTTSDATQISVVWLAAVPFGYVRHESVSRVDGTRSQMTLQSFTFGN
jgi:hypothetical protein